ATTPSLTPRRSMCGRGFMNTASPVGKSCGGPERGGIATWWTNTYRPPGSTSHHLRLSEATERSAAARRSSGDPQPVRQHQERDCEIVAGRLAAHPIPVDPLADGADTGQQRREIAMVLVE